MFSLNLTLRLHKFYLCGYEENYFFTRIHFNIWICSNTITDANIQTAVDLWVSDRSAATTTYGNISDWDVSQVTDMSELFKDKTNFNDDISNWDVSNVTNMSVMFSDATSFNQDISSWDVSSVTDMSAMFFMHHHLIKILVLGM